MVNCCCVTGCNEKFVRGGPVTFHCFPVDEKRRKEWENALGRENFKASNFSQICSKHFEKKCFDKERFGGTWLKADAVPTIFDFSEQSLSENEDRKSPTPPPDPNEPTSNFDEYCSREYRRKRKWFLGDFKQEDMNSEENALRVLELANEEHVKKTATIKKLRREKACLAKKVASLQKLLLEAQNELDAAKSDVESSETVVKEKKDPSPIEPIVQIKEEPLDDCLNPSTTKDTANEEFILPHNDNSWTTPNLVVEPQFTISVASLAAPNKPEACDGEQLKKKLRTSPPETGTLVSSSNDTEMKPEGPVQNLEEISNPCCCSKEHRKDQFDAFGNYVAAKLRSLDKISSAFAQNEIGNVILEAEMGKYLASDVKCKILNCANKHLNSVSAVSENSRLQYAEKP